MHIITSWLPQPRAFRLWIGLCCFVAATVGILRTFVFGEMFDQPVAALLFAVMITFLCGLLLLQRMGFKIERAYSIMCGVVMVDLAIWPSIRIEMPTIVIVPIFIFTYLFSVLTFSRESERAKL